MKEVVLFYRGTDGIVVQKCKVLEDFKNGSLKILFGNAPATAYAGTWLKLEHCPEDLLEGK